MDDVKTWQSMPLEALYLIVYLDCLVIKVREDKQIINKAVYLALGVDTDGQKERLGMWISQNEGAKFWLSVLTELQNRGLQKVYSHECVFKLLFLAIHNWKPAVNRFMIEFAESKD